MKSNLLRIAYNNRKLIRTFAVIDLKLRYKNSVLGFFWSILEPLLLLSVLYLVFTFIFASEILHFPLYLLLGIIIWNSFTRGTIMSMNSIVGRGGLVTSIYFPRIILPIAANTTSFLMMGFEFGILAAFMIAFQFVPPVTIFLFPLILLFLFILCNGTGFILSVLYVKYKDVLHIWQIITYAGFFLTPIIYSLQIFPDEVKNFILLNPLAQIVEISHNAVLYGMLPNIIDFLYILGIVVTIFFVGLLIFQKKEKTVIDEI